IGPRAGSSCTRERLLPSRRLRKLADVARAVLLAATVLAGLVAWLFAARPQWIDALDDRIVRAHTGWAEAALARAAREGLAPADRIAELRALLADLADVRKGERRAPIRREAARLLARCQLEAGDAAGAQRTAAQWLAFDPPDVDARLALHAAHPAPPGPRQGAAARSAARRRVCWRAASSKQATRGARSVLRRSGSRSTRSTSTRGSPCTPRLRRSRSDGRTPRRWRATCSRSRPTRSTCSCRT